MNMLNNKNQDSDFLNWLAGFIDGEGCFSIIKNGRSCWRTEFAIKLRDDDTNIINIIHNQLLIGKVRHIKKTELGSPQVSFVIANKSDSLKLVRILDECPLRAKKKRDYVIWRQAV
ncbi:unnamed protein product, partial [marine sediment metagenome]